MKTQIVDGQDSAQIKSQNQALDSILNQLVKANEAYVNIFNDDQFKSDILTMKHTSFLYKKMFTYLGEGTASAEQRNNRKETFSVYFRRFIRKFIDQHILSSFEKCYQDEQLISCLIEKWQQFKKFCFLYKFLLTTADNHYEQSYKAYKNMGKTNKINSEDSIFPVPVISIYYFDNLVFKKYKEHITKIIREMASLERQGKIIEREALRTLFQIVYSCGLAELTRIEAVKNNSNQTTFQFFISPNKQIEKQFTNARKNPNQTFFNNILNDIILDSEIYYKNFFEEKISRFGPHEDFVTVKNILQKQEQISQYYFFSHEQKNEYLNKIRAIIVATNLEERLTKQNSLRFYLQQFNSTSDQYLNEIKIIVDSLFKAKQQSITIVQNVVRAHLMENGAKLNEKINKRKQYINQIVNMKKSMNRIIDELMQKNLNMCIVRDNCFKKILDSIEASKNLAEFTDFKIKECIKNKVSESQFVQKTNDVFLVLENLAATDSFLIYHQQFLGRRLIEPLSDPKIDIQKFILQKIGEKLGVVTVSVHFLMIKDIQKSQDLIDNFTKKMSNAKFKFCCRIISPSYWPDNINNSNVQLTLPQTLRIEAQTISEHFQNEFMRSLNWKVDKGNSLFQGSFKSGKFRFQSQNLFLIILLHISEGNNHEIRFWELLQKINKKKQGILNHMIKCVKVLIENGLVTRSNPNQSENIQEGELISIKMSFEPLSNYKENQTILIKASQEMYRAMHETTVEYNKIIKERQKIVEAVLVKLLKHSHSTGNNQMTLEQLVKGVREYDHLKNLEISLGMVKQRIQEIIIRGYCERNANDRKVFHYIA